jgi:hypothetical protein
MSLSTVTVRQLRAVTGDPARRSKSAGVNFEVPAPSG